MQNTRTHIVVIHIVASIRLKSLHADASTIVTSAMIRWLGCCRHRREVHEPPYRPGLSAFERWVLLIKRMKKIGKRKRIGNLCFNTLCPTHDDFLANCPMTGFLLPDLRRRCNVTLRGRA